MSQSVTIASFANIVEAEVAKNLLETNGIHAAIMSDDAGGMLFPLTNEVKLMVLDDDAELARQILESSEQQSP